MKEADPLEWFIILLLAGFYFYGIFWVAGYFYVSRKFFKKRSLKVRLNDPNVEERKTNE